MSTKLKYGIGLAFILAYWAYAISHIATPGTEQWDFKTYYWAAEVHKSGGDHYDLQALNRASPDEIKLPYVYPPLSIYFFRPFALFDWNTAYQLWLWIKVMLGIALIVIWRHFFYRGGSPAIFLLFALLAFSSALYWDLLAGNVSMIEQLLLWLGLVFFLQKRGILFALFIVLASLFKFTFLGFLVLCLGLPKEARVKAAIVGLTSAAGYAIANFAVSPGQFSSFVKAVSSVKEGGAEYNHSLLAFLTDAAELARAGAGINLDPSWAVSFVYVIAALIVVLISVRVWKGLKEVGEKRGLLLIVLVCITFAVVAPRMKTYTYILLILPSYYVIRECTRAHALILLFLLMSLTKWTPLPTIDAVRLLWWHYPWLLALLSWVLLLRYLRQASGQRASLPDS